MPDPKWKIYYGDRHTTYSGQDGTPWDAPARDVQVIVLEDNYHGWYTQTGHNYYVWDDRGTGFRWYGIMDLFGLYDYLLEPGKKKVIFGRTIPPGRFNEIFKKASIDPYFEQKKSFRARERVPTG